MLNSRRWAEIRARGRRDFVLRFGVRLGLIAGTFYAVVFLWAGYHIFSHTRFDDVIIAIIAFLVSPAMLSLAALAAWHANEAIYSRRKERGNPAVTT